MLFYIVLSSLAILGILAVLIHHFQGSELARVNLLAILKENFSNWRKELILKKVSTSKDQVKRDYQRGLGFFKEEKTEVRDELWQDKSTEDLCFMIEDELKRDDCQRALKFLEFLLQRNHEREVQEYIYSLVVTAYEKAGALNSALDYCHKLLETSPADQGCRLKIAEFQLRTGDYKKAEESARSVLELEQDSLAALDILAKVYAKTFRSREAEELKRKVVSLRMMKKS